MTILNCKVVVNSLLSNNENTCSAYTRIVLLPFLLENAVLISGLRAFFFSYLAVVRSSDDKAVAVSVATKTLSEHEVL